MRWFLAAAFSCLSFAAVTSSTLVPLRDSAGIDYLFAWPGAPVLGVVWSVVLTALVAFFLVVLRTARHSSESAAALAREGRWLAPLAGLGFTIVGILPAVPGVGERAAPLGYFFYDLRWWWLAFLVGWTLVRAESVVGSPIRRRLTVASAWAPATRLLAMDSAIFIAVIAWATATTPHLRFSGMLHGDEPKYLRYCEVWYQGGGLDISGKSLFSDERLDSAPHLLSAAAQIPRTIVEESRALAADLGQFVTQPLAFRWNRVTGGNGFVQGKHGGVYQVHQPGLSAILFPGYFIDRYLLGLHPGYQGEFPEELVMTNLTMLVVYGFCAAALFRLLRNLLASDLLAMLWATIGVVTLPPSAFAFQLYPELPALLIILVVSNFLLVRAAQASGAACFIAGAATGALCWLHPRFLLLSVAIAVTSTATVRTASRRALMAGYGLVLLSVMGFNYRVTGSWLPTAIYTANAEGTLNPFAVPMNLTGYLFHRTWGLLPHSLLLIGVAPGIVNLARSRPALVAILLAFMLCLGIPAAGHSLSAAAGTPGRLVLAVVPLSAWPLATIVRRFWSSAAVRCLSVLLVILSLDASLTYNWTHKKPLGPIHGIGMSGWKPNLMFPDIYATASDMSASSIAVLLGWILIVALLAFFCLTPPRARGAPAAAFSPAWLSHATMLGAILTIAFTTTTVMGRWSYDAYLLDDYESQRLAARALVDLDRCRVCFTSREGPIDWTALKPNRADAMAIELAPGRGSVGVRINLAGDDDRFARFGRVHVDFGDGHATPWMGIVDEGQYEHQYRQPGTYSVVTWLQLRDGRTRLDRRTIHVGGAQSGG